MTELEQLGQGITTGALLAIGIVFVTPMIIWFIYFLVSTIYYEIKQMLNQKK